MKIRFCEDKWFKGELLFEAGKVYEVSAKDGWLGRWLKRGGELVVDDDSQMVLTEQPAVLEQTVAPATNQIETTETETHSTQSVRSPRRTARHKTPLEDL